MIALWAGLALADPCAREVVVGRGLVVTPGQGVVVAAELGVRLVLRSRRIDGIPTFYARHARLSWRWLVASDGPVRVDASVGRGDALCEGEVRDEMTVTLSAGEHLVEHEVTAEQIDACRVRVVLARTSHQNLGVILEVVGARPPGPDAPVSGPVTVNPGSDLVIDIPACL